MAEYDCKNRHAHHHMSSDPCRSNRVHPRGIGTRSTTVTGMAPIEIGTRSTTVTGIAPIGPTRVAGHTMMDVAIFPVIFGWTMMVQLVQSGLYTIILYTQTFNFTTGRVKLMMPLLDTCLPRIINARAFPLTTRIGLAMRENRSCEHMTSSVSTTSHTIAS